jgi:hypothetical protein
LLTPLCNPLYPLRHSHDPEPTDFLLIIGKKVHKQHNQATVGSNNLSVTLRPFPSSIFCCGQTGKQDQILALCLGYYLLIMSSYASPFVLTFSDPKSRA